MLALSAGKTQRIRIRIYDRLLRGKGKALHVRQEGAVFIEVPRSLPMAQR